MKIDTEQNYDGSYSAYIEDEAGEEGATIGYGSSALKAKIDLICQFDSVQLEEFITPFLEG